MDNHRLIYQDDISDEMYNIFLGRLIAWDIETSGLNWETDKIALCTLYTEGIPVTIIRIDDENNNSHKNLCKLLKSVTTYKLFHHAMFDLRFMKNRWNFYKLNSCICTKIAAKVLYAHDRSNNGESTSLKPLLKKFLNVEINKAEQMSDWFAKELSVDQLEYATCDVIYLKDLLFKLKETLNKEDIFDLVNICWEFIPTRVELDLRKCKDVFLY